MNEKVLVKDSEIEGKGVFTIRDVLQGEMILAIDDSHIVNDPKSISEEDKEHMDYLADGKVILMQSPEVYINHSCDPNTYVKTFNGKRQVIAMRDIRVGEEVTYDYAINGDYSWGAECKCGALNCRGIVNPNFWELPRDRQIEYLPYLDNWFVEKYKDRVKSLLGN